MNKLKYFIATMLAINAFLCVLGMLICGAVKLVEHLQTMMPPWFTEAVVIEVVVAIAVGIVIWFHSDSDGCGGWYL